MVIILCVTLQKRVWSTILFRVEKFQFCMKFLHREPSGTKLQSSRSITVIYLLEYATFEIYERQHTASYFSESPRTSIFFYISAHHRRELEIPVSRAP